MKLKKLFFLSLTLLFIFGQFYVTANPKGNCELEQTERLSALCKVWGLLKYYHPDVATGSIDWDWILVSAYEPVKAAVDFESFNQEIDNLIQEAGGIEKMDYNPHTPAHPNETLFKWIKDNDIFSKDVRHKLQTLQKKHTPTTNAYVTLHEDGNPTFNEEWYHSGHFPSERFRFMSLCKYWNIIRYFFPSRELMDQDWEEVLEEFIPRIINAAETIDFQLSMKELTARINDGHAFYWNYILNTYFGTYYPPFTTRFIENQSVVTKLYTRLLDTPNQFRIGDIILKWQGTEIDELREQNKRYIAASNQSYLDYSLNSTVFRSTTEQIIVTISRNGHVHDITLNGSYNYEIDNESAYQKSLLEKWKILPDNIGYIYMGTLMPADVSQAMSELMNTRAIIFDLRCYPNNTIYEIAEYLLPSPRPFVKFSKPDLDYPGTFVYTEDYFAGPENNPDYYKGRIVVLVDEQTMSEAEFSCMILQVAPDTTIIGSQTAGADGNISQILLPGYIMTYMSGLGVYYPDGTETQRIGIVPDIEIRPTIEGLRQGRDEVLEKAVEFIQKDD